MKNLESTWPEPMLRVYNGYYFIITEACLLGAGEKDKNRGCILVRLPWPFFLHYRFYPHHYAPYVSDVFGISTFKPHFELGQPFLPFQQLMAVLPPASRQHVPPVFAVSERAVLEKDQTLLLRTSSVVYVIVGAHDVAAVAYY